MFCYRLDPKNLGIRDSVSFPKAAAKVLAGTADNRLCWYSSLSATCRKAHRSVPQPFPDPRTIFGGSRVNCSTVAAFYTRELPYAPAIIYRAAVWLL